MKQEIGTTQNAPIKWVGPTYSGVFGSEPFAVVKGRDTKPTVEDFNGSSK